MNNDKTEIMACGTLVKLKQINIDPVTIGRECIALADEVKDLGVFIDSNMSFNQHVSFLRKSCHFQLRKISSIEMVWIWARVSRNIFFRFLIFLNPFGLTEPYKQTYITRQKTVKLI